MDSPDYEDKHYQRRKADLENRLYKTYDKIDEAQDNIHKEAEKDTVLLASAQQRAQKLLEDYVNNIGACTGKTYTIKRIYLDDVL